ncbi:MAG TPA: hypothetical protein VGB85_19575 [Nannocystis sp.]
MSPASPVTATPPAVLAEVVAHFGERVVDIQHVGVEPEPRVPAAGWYTLGACAMVLGLGLVMTSLPDAPRIEPTDTEAVDAPAPAPGPGAAGLGALLVLLGVVPLVIAARSQHVPRDRYVIGEGPDVHLPVALPPGATQAGVPLVRALERQIVLGLVPGMTGELHDGAQTTAVADLVAQGRSSYALPADARADLRLGDLRFTVQAVERAAFVPKRGRLDRLYMLSNAGALAALGALLLLGEPSTGELEIEEQSARRLLAVQYLTDVPPPPPPPPAVAPPVPRDRPSSAPPKPAAPPPAPSTVDELAVEVTGPAQIVPRGTRRGIRDDHSYARVAGVLNDAEFNASIQRATADTQEGLLGYDNEADRAMWVAVRDAPVINRPLGGLELAETERGGGLHDDRPKPTKAPGKNVEIDMYAKRTPPSAAAIAAARRVVTIELETPNVVGELTPLTIRESLRKQADGLKRCFRETVDNAERVGHVVLMLKVAGAGKVTSAQLKWGSTQLGPIGPCITRIASTWKFPATLDRMPASIVVEVVYSAKDM